MWWMRTVGLRRDGVTQIQRPDPSRHPSCRAQSPGSGSIGQGPHCPERLKPGLSEGELGTPGKQAPGRPAVGFSAHPTGPLLTP